MLLLHILIWCKEWPLSLLSQGILPRALFLLFVSRHNCEDTCTMIIPSKTKMWKFYSKIWIYYLIGFHRWKSYKNDPKNEKKCRRHNLESFGTSQFTSAHWGMSPDVEHNNCNLKDKTGWCYTIIQCKYISMITIQCKLYV